MYFESLKAGRKSLRRSSSRAARRIPTDLHGRSDKVVAIRYTATMVSFQGFEAILTRYIEEVTDYHCSR